MGDADRDQCAISPGQSAGNAAHRVELQPDRFWIETSARSDHRFGCQPPGSPARTSPRRYFGNDVSRSAECRGGDRLCFAARLAPGGNRGAAIRVRAGRDRSAGRTGGRAENPAARRFSEASAPSCWTLRAARFTARIHLRSSGFSFIRRMARIGFAKFIADLPAASNDPRPICGSIFRSCRATTGMMRAWTTQIARFSSAPFNSSARPKPNGCWMHCG